MTLALLQAVTDTTSQHLAENAHLFEEIDPIGLGMSAVGMVVVFMSLLLLYIVFTNVTKLISIKIQKPEVKKETKQMTGASDDVTGEVNAAIAMAIYLYSKEIHDIENTVLTINRVSKAYSPWSSKIYGLRQYPKR